MESSSVFVERIKYYIKPCCSKYVSKTGKVNELNEYFRNYLEKISSHILAPERALTRIT